MGARAHTVSSHLAHTNTHTQQINPLNQTKVHFFSSVRMTFVLVSFSLSLFVFLLLFFVFRSSFFFFAVFSFIKHQLDIRCVEREKKCRVKHFWMNFWHVDDDEKWESSQTTTANENARWNQPSHHDIFPCNEWYAYCDFLLYEDNMQTITLRLRHGCYSFALCCCDCSCYFVLFVCACFFIFTLKSCCVLSIHVVLVLF